MSANLCVCCGAIIPEGRQVCPICERGREPMTRNEAIEYLRQVDFITPKEQEARDMAIKALKEPERKHGAWRPCQNGKWMYAVCCECGKMFNNPTNYCPNCGAEMRGEKNDG